MDLRNYEVMSDDEITEVWCVRCARIVATTVDRARLPVEYIARLVANPTLADLLTVATQHNPLHRVTPAVASQPYTHHH